MPEARMLSRRISQSKTLGGLKSDSARLLYTWLIPFLDVEGRYSADPEIIKGYIFPKIKSMTPLKINRLLKELAEDKLIVLYSANGETFLQFKKFHELQPGMRSEREAKSIIPNPNSGVMLENSRTNKIKLNKDKLNKSISSNPKNQDSTIQLIYDFYIWGFNKNPNLYKLTPKREQKIKSRLKEFADSKYLLWAVYAISQSSFHQGKNEDNKKFIELDEHIFRSQEQTERWIREFQEKKYYQVFEKAYKEFKEKGK